MDINSLINPTSAAKKKEPSKEPPPDSATETPTDPLAQPPTKLCSPIGVTPVRTKRKRHDPIPIWARTEADFALRPPSPSFRPPKPPPVHRQSPGVKPAESGNTTHPENSHTETAGLRGFRRPITDDGRIYDEISWMVCKFLWQHVVDDMELRQAVAESNGGTKVEIEAKWGQIQGRRDASRLWAIHETETVLRKDAQQQTKFASTMSLEQHKKMNQFLNSHVQTSKQRDAMRAEIDYKHIRETDVFFELDQSDLNLIPPSTRQLLATTKRLKLRETRDTRTGEVRSRVVKHRLADLEISSPQTEWDYRISISVEIHYPTPVHHLTRSTEAGSGGQGFERKKDRMSYSYLGAYQIDLTQVTTVSGKNHELELELDGDVLVAAAEKADRGESQYEFEDLVSGMINNLRVLSREVTGPAVVVAGA